MAHLNRSADIAEMAVHRLGAGPLARMCGGQVVLGTGGREQNAVCVAAMAPGPWPGPLVGPYSPQHALLAHAGFILERYLDRLLGRIGVSGQTREPRLAVDDQSLFSAHLKPVSNRYQKRKEAHGERHCTDITHAGADARS